MRTMIGVFVTTVLFAAQPLAAQPDGRALSFDVRGGYSFPFGDFSDSAESDFGFGVGAVFNLTNSFGIYGGWARDGFGCDICTDDDQIHASGFEGGIKFLIPSERSIVPWLKAGVIGHTVTFDSGIVAFESDRKYGFQGAAGIDFPLGDVVSVSPAVRVNFLDLDDPDDDDFLESAEVRWLSLDIGAHFHIPRN